LNEKKEECKTIIDIGCSNGLVLFLSNFLGYQKIYGLEHETECVELINNIKNELNYNNIYPKKYSFGDIIDEQVDIICMFAIIHWIYGCTANFYCFDDIFKYIKKYVKKYLLIEWVSETDNVISKNTHINYNKNEIKEEYNLKNFERSLIQNIGKIENIIHLEKNTRFLYIVKVE
jgi:hypothetical protein